MRGGDQNGRPSPALFGAAGWLFADLLLAIAMLFLVANSVAHVTPPPTPTPTPTLTPKPTPLPVLDLKPVVITITNVNYAALHAGDPATIADIERQIKANKALQGRRAGLELTFGGSGGGQASGGLQAARDMDVLVLPGLANQGFVFRGCVYREFFAIDKPIGTLELDIYVFKQ